ncbi:MAG: hypothetical protein ACUVXF_04780 [Desulfobaccales bacterium]
MESFRHNLSPVEVKKFLKITAKAAEHLFIRFCWKVPTPCPRCGAHRLCRAGAVSFYSSSIDKVTHEFTACLDCGFISMSMLQTIESL